MKKFFIALQFLTSLPVKIKAQIPDKEFAESMAYFPLVGLLMGLALALAYNIFNLIFPHSINCALILILNIVLTGGLHMDGFIDTFDGIASRGDKKEILKIMREGRPGAIGVSAAILLFLLKYSLLVSLPKEAIGPSLVAMTTLSRWTLVVSSGLYPYAREGEGLGRKFVQGLGLKEGFISTAVALLIAFLVFELRIFILVPLVFCALVGFNSYLHKRIGGITGDTLGALNELIEVLILMLTFILIKR